MRQNKISLTKDGLVHEPRAVQLHAVEGRMRNAPTLQEPAHHACLSYTEEHKQLSVRSRYFHFMLIQNQHTFFTMFRIRIQLGLWFKEISCFEVMDVLFGGLEARKPFIERSKNKNIAFQNKKSEFCVKL
jgi:hypothetical protein